MGLLKLLGLSAKHQGQHEAGKHSKGTAHKSKQAKQGKQGKK